MEKFKNGVKNLWHKVNNKGTILAIASAVIIIITNLGVNVDADKWMYVINSLCGVGIALGVINNPNTQGIDNPFKNHQPAEVEETVKDADDEVKEVEEKNE